MNQPPDLRVPPASTGSEPEPDPFTSAEPRRRIPNLGHAMLFLALAGILLLLFQGLLLLGKHPLRTQDSAALTVAPKLLLASMAGTYLATLVASWAFFPKLWSRDFLSGLQWRWPTAQRQALRLVPLGFALAITAQAALYYLTPPKSLPIEEMFASAGDAWLTTAFGILLAPAFEEICFRGFLVPAFAIAYDWLALPRTPEAHTRWEASTTLSPLALIFSAILSSLFFALLHAQQVGHLIPALLSCSASRSSSPSFGSRRNPSPAPLSFTPHTTASSSSRSSFRPAATATWRSSSNKYMLGTCVLRSADDALSLDHRIMKIESLAGLPRQSPATQSQRAPTTPTPL